MRVLKDYKEEKTEQSTDKDRNDIVLTLDVSGSMAGRPLEETKHAATKFVKTILSENANIGIVTYDDSSKIEAPLSTSEALLSKQLLGIVDGGGTNMEAGLNQAYMMLKDSHAKKKIIVLMSDGVPNYGKTGQKLIDFADSIKGENIYIYTLGFFENMTNGKASAQKLMEEMATEGCHYEVSDADKLVFFFGDMADQINGQKYIYVRIACPVDVTVSHAGEMLCSDEKKLNTRTDFGTLTLEESDEAESDDKVKVLRLKDGTDYDIQIQGTGCGFMDYTIGFMDEDGEYSDMRTFTNIKISKKTVIDTVAASTSKTVLKVDEDGDGSYDLRYEAKVNGRGELIDYTNMICVIVVVFFILIGIFIKLKKSRKGG